MREHDIQAAFIQWAANHPDPRTGMIFAIPNGGLRSPKTGATLKREGVRAGVPDLFLAAPSAGYHGLFIEFKTEKGRVSGDQKNWIRALRDQKYKVALCRSLEDAIGITQSYLSEANPLS
jgi:hypothetical protein